MNLRPSFYLIASIIVVVGLYLVWDVKDPETNAVQELTKAPMRPIVQTEDQTPEVAPPAKQIAPNRKNAIDQLKELADSKKPEDAFKRYQILAACFHDAEELKSFDSWAINEDNRLHIAERKPELEKSMRQCVGVDYTAMAHRFDLLNLAVRANVKGAASAYLHEGPNGDKFALETRPTDPNVLDWKRQAIAQLENAAQHCDQSAMSDLAQVYFFNVITRKDPAKEFFYMAAMYELRGRKISQSSEKYLEKLSQTLTKSKIDEVNFQIKQITQNCKLQH